MLMTDQKLTVELLTKKADVILIEVRKTLDSTIPFLQEYIELPFEITGPQKLSAAEAAMFDILSAIDHLIKMRGKT